MESATSLKRHECSLCIFSWAISHHVYLQKMCLLQSYLMEKKTHWDPPSISTWVFWYLKSSLLFSLPLRHSHNKTSQALYHCSVLQATESWVGPGNKATKEMLVHILHDQVSFTKKCTYHVVGIPPRNVTQSLVVIWLRQWPSLVLSLLIYSQREGDAQQ